MTVVAFQPKEKPRLIWRCDCGCLTMFLHSDATAECAACGVFATGLEGDWRAPLPEQPDSPREVSPGDNKVVDLGSADVAVRRALKRIEPDDVTALVVINRDGSLSAWSEAETDKQGSWLRRKMREALRLMLAPVGAKQ